MIEQQFLITGYRNLEFVGTDALLAREVCV